MNPDHLTEPSTRFGEIKSDEDVVNLLGFIASILTPSGALQRDCLAAIQFLKTREPQIPPTGS
jgi:hypothetical protein